jgi:hypothetical protein
MIFKSIRPRGWDYIRARVYAGKWLPARKYFGGLSKSRGSVSDPPHPPVRENCRVLYENGRDGRFPTFPPTSERTDGFPHSSGTSPPDPPFFRADRHSYLTSPLPPIRPLFFRVCARHDLLALREKLFNINLPPLFCSAWKLWNNSL